MDDNQQNGQSPNYDRTSQITGSSSLYQKNINQSRAQSQLSRNTGGQSDQFVNGGSNRSSGSGVRTNKEDLFVIGTE